MIVQARKNCPQRRLRINGFGMYRLLKHQQSKPAEDVKSPNFTEAWGMKPPSCLEVSEKENCWRGNPFKQWSLYKWMSRIRRMSSDWSEMLSIQDNKTVPHHHAKHTSSSDDFKQSDSNLHVDLSQQPSQFAGDKTSSPGLTLTTVTQVQALAEPSRRSHVAIVKTQAEGWALLLNEGVREYSPDRLGQESACCLRYVVWATTLKQDQRMFPWCRIRNLLLSRQNKELRRLPLDVGMAFEI
jgi:hypothetical protein